MTNQSTPIVCELAEVFHDREEAMLVLQRSDFPMCRLPEFTNPLSFWSEVTEKACNGMLPGGIQRVIDTAARLYPENPMFRSMGSWDASATPQMSISPGAPRHRPTVAAAADEEVRALVRTRVDSATAKAPIGRWIFVITIINSLLTAGVVGVLYVLPPMSASTPLPEARVLTSEARVLTPEARVLTPEARVLTPEEDEDVGAVEEQRGLEALERGSTSTKAQRRKPKQKLKQEPKQEPIPRAREEAEAKEDADPVQAPDGMPRTKRGGLWCRARTRVRGWLPGEDPSDCDR